MSEVKNTLDGFNSSLDTARTKKKLANLKTEQQKLSKTKRREKKNQKEKKVGLGEKRIHELRDHIENLSSQRKRREYKKSFKK